MPAKVRVGSRNTTARLPSSAPTQLGFTTLAALMTLIAGARLVQIDLSDIKAPTEDCIRTAATATAFVVDLKYQQAEGKLEDAVKACPRYGEAWSSLGQTRFYEGVSSGDPAVAKRDWPRAQQAYQRALDAADTRSGEMYNDLWAVLAELAVARGDDATAERLLRQAAYNVKDAGPYLRNDYFFASLRYDRDYFEQAGIAGSKVDTFFEHGREYEALLDSGHMTTPLDTHGARISKLVFRKSDSVLGRVAKAVTIGFDYSGLKVGDVLSFRFYGYRDSTYDPTASLTQTVAANSSLLTDGVERPDTDFRLTLTYQYETTLEVYLNGVFMAQASFTP